VSGQSSSFSELKENDRLLTKTLGLAAKELPKINVCSNQSALTENLQIIDKRSRFVGIKDEEVKMAETYCQKG
jgi:hypothetical protein